MFDELLFRQDGVLSRRQALRHLSSGAIERHLTAGRWQAVHRGVYVTHSGPPTRSQRRWAAALVAGCGRVAPLGGVSALEVMGLRGFGSEALHVVVPATHRVRHLPWWVLVHRTRRLVAADVHRVADPPGTMPARSLIDAARWASTDDRARALIAAGFQQRLVNADDAGAALARAPVGRRQALIVAAIRDAVAGAHSVPEADFLRLCRRHRLPVPALQHRRRDARGRQRYLDAYFEGWGVHVEIDGAQHTDPGQWWADMRRQNDLWIAGDRVLRFPAWLIRRDPAEVMRQVRAALRAAGWDGVDV